jgi:hypothetical protein
MIGLRNEDDSSDDELEDPDPAPEASSNIAHEDDGIHRGAIEAVKLTGDPNIPRGEHTFIADDIGPAGLIRIAEEHPFRGARVVKSRGHVAARGFLNGESGNVLVHQYTLVLTCIR